MPRGLAKIALVAWAFVLSALDLLSGVPTDGTENYERKRRGEKE